MAPSFKLNLKETKPADIPSEEILLQVGRELIASVDSWKKGKAYHKDAVQTYTKSGDGAPWFYRVSQHSQEEATFQEFWNKLGVNKPINEKAFVPTVTDVKKLKEITPSQQIWSLTYAFPAPLSARVFTVLQAIQLDEASKTGLIVSIPIDIGSDPELAAMDLKGVKAKYVSVEQIKQLDNGNVEWRAAVSLTTSSRMLDFMTHRDMPSGMADDVPLFLNWLKAQRSEVANEKVAAQDAATVAVTPVA